MTHYTGKYENGTDKKFIAFHNKTLIEGKKNNQNEAIHQRVFTLFQHSLLVDEIFFLDLAHFLNYKKWGIEPYIYFMHMNF